MKGTPQVEKKEPTFVAFEVEDENQYLQKGLRLEGADAPFCLTASKDGVVLEGKFNIDSDLVLQDFARVLGDVWKKHRRLKL
jgi:hypothetical protein